MATSSSSPGKEKKIYYTTFKQPDIVYTNLDNLEQTIRQQQAELMHQQQQQHLQQQHLLLVRSNSRGTPVFKAPPPPSSRLLTAAEMQATVEGGTNCHSIGGDISNRLMSGAVGQAAVKAVNGNGHEQSTSFMGSEDESRQWEWKVKIRPDGSRYRRA